MAQDLTNAMRTAVDAARTHLEMIAQDERIGKAHAKYLRRLYGALIDEGFSPEQALTLVAGASLPGR